MSLHHSTRRRVPSRQKPGLRPALCTQAHPVYTHSSHGDGLAQVSHPRWKHREPPTCKSPCMSGAPANRLSEDNVSSLESEQFDSTLSATDPWMRSRKQKPCFRSGKPVHPDMYLGNQQPVSYPIAWIPSTRGNSPDLSPRRRPLVHYASHDHTAGYAP